MTVLYSTDFESFADFEVPAGWSTVSNSNGWKVRDVSAYATSGAKSLLAIGMEDGYPGIYTGIAARTAIDSKFKSPAKFYNSNLLLQTVFHANYVDATDLFGESSYRVVFTATSSSVTAHIYRWDGNTYSSSLANGTRSWSVSADNKLNTRLLVDGVNVSVWVWNETNESMPASALVTYTDSTQRIAGWFGIGLNNAGNSTLTSVDDVVISDISAGGASASFTITSDDATFGGGATVSPMTSFMVTAESSVFAGAASIGTAEAEFAVATENSTFYGGAVGYAAQGTITTPALKNNTGTILANESGITAYVYNPVTGALIVKLTGQTTNGLGVMTLTDAAIVSGTQYRVVIVLSSGDEGMEKLTAS